MAVGTGVDVGMGVGEGVNVGRKVAVWTGVGVGMLVGVGELKGVKVGDSVFLSPRWTTQHLQRNIPPMVKSRPTRDLGRVFVGR